MDDAWLEHLEPRVPGGEPAFDRIADAIVRAIADGQLKAGERLPTHRALARRLGVAVPTVTRAYQAAAHRGLVVSATGRGMFVAGIPELRDEQDVSRKLDMAVNAPARGPHGPALRGALERLSRQPDLHAELGYAAEIGSARHRSLAADWLGRRGVEASHDDIAITHGTQHALFVAFAAAAHQGGAIATESLTYPGARSAAQMLGLELVPIAIDGQGLVPDALARWCRAAAAPRVLYTTPFAHNPTARTQSAQRRRQLVDVARAHDVTIVEDDVFGLLDESGTPPLAATAPERTLHVTSVSKAIAPGLRVGTLAGPSHLMQRVGPLIRATIFNAAPLQTAITMAWLEDGTADRLVEWQRVQARERRECALSLLGECPAVRSLTAAALHVWVELAPHWSPAEAIAAAASVDVLIGPTSHFAVGALDERGVRLCLGNAPSVEALAAALERLDQSWRQPFWVSGT